MRRAAAGVLLVGTVLAPTPSYAHLVNSGLGPFYDGAIHLILTPMDLVGLLTLSLFAGTQGEEAGRLVVMAAPLAWFAAGAVALHSEMVGSFPALNAIALIVLGATVALDLKVPITAAGAVAAAYAGLLGHQSGLELRVAEASWVALTGTVTVVLAITLLVSALIASFSAFAFRVVVRVLGSWAVATGLLSIGWLAGARA